MNGCHGMLIFRLDFCSCELQLLNKIVFDHHIADEMILEESSRRCVQTLDKKENVIWRIVATFEDLSKICMEET